MNKGFSLLRKIGFALIFALASIFISPLSAQAAAPVCFTPSITGTAGIGTTLSAVPSCSNSPTSYTYQWKSSTTSTGTYANIAGATTSSFVVSSAEAGLYIKVAISGTNADGTSAVATSAANGPQKFVAEPFVGTNTSGYLDGQGLTAQFGNLSSMTNDGTYIYVTEYSDYTIRRIDQAGNVTTIAGDRTRAVLDGVGTSARLHSPTAIVYNPLGHSLFIKDASVIRELDIATGQLTTLRNRQQISTVSRSNFTVTLTFTKPHGLAGSVTVAGVGAPYDGTFSVSSPTATTLSYNLGTTATVAAFSPSNATATGDLGPSRTDANSWWNYYQSMDVAPDGRIYMGRSNSGETNTDSRILRFTRLSGSTFTFERLSYTGGTPCAIAMMSNTEMLLGTCGSVNKLTTTDDWATYSTGPTLASTQNAGLMYDPAGYLNITENQVNLNTGVTLTKFRGTVVILEMWTMLGNDIYVMDYISANPRRIFKYVGAGSGQTIFSVTNKTVTFNANGGAGSMNAQSASSATNLTANAYTLSGSTFSGWNTAANGSGTSYADAASYSFAANITLYAQWTAGQIQNNQVVQQPQASNSLTAVTKWSVSACTDSESFNVTIEGRGLDKVSATSENSKATVVSATESVMKLQLSEAQSAINWLRLSGSDSIITLQHSFACAQQTTPSALTSLRVQFAANSSSVAAAEAKRVKSLLKGFAEPTSLSIIGSTSALSSSKADVRLAAARAKATAVLVRSIFKSVVIEITNSPAAGVGSRYRSAEVTFESAKR